MGPARTRPTACAAPSAFTWFRNMPGSATGPAAISIAAISGQAIRLWMKASSRYSGQAKGIGQAGSTVIAIRAGAWLSRDLLDERLLDDELARHRRAALAEACVFEQGA